MTCCLRKISAPMKRASFLSPQRAASTLCSVAHYKRLVPPLLGSSQSSNRHRRFVKGWDVGIRLYPPGHMKACAP